MSGLAAGNHKLKADTSEEARAGPSQQEVKSRLCEVYQVHPTKTGPLGITLTNTLMQAHLLTCTNIFISGQ